MITPKVEFFYRKIKSVAISINLRKWRFFLPFINRPSVFTDVSVFIKALNGLLGDDILVSKPSTDSLKEWAEQAMRHEITVLGSPVRLYENMPWHEDIKSGKVWKSGKYFRDYVQIDASDKSDVKVPWEISRCHHLLYLGQAYREIKDEKYADEVIRQIEDWIDGNPFMHSINWTCSMEVAIRAVNWMWAINLMSDSASITDDFVKKISKSFYEHGFYIYNNIEDAEQHNGNHLISDLVGLIYIGALLKKNKKAQTWYVYAKNALYNEIRTQFLPSGFHYEKSLAYHGLVTEMISHAVVLMRTIGEEIPMDIEHRVRLMQEVLGRVKKDDGCLPNIADNDDGRFLPSLVTPCLKNTVVKQATILIAPDAGFVLHKTDNHYLFVSNSGISKYPEKGRYNTAHTHCDLLSFELSVCGKDFIVDPGTCNYTGDLAKRDEFRSTRKHNTVQVDNVEQFKFERKRPFQMFDNVKLTSLVSEEQNGFVNISGSYEIVCNDLVIKHHRSFNWSHNSIEIKDDVGCLGHHRVTLYFHISPGVAVEEFNNGYKLYSGEQHIVITPDSLLNCCVIPDTVSKSYGTEQKSKTLVFQGEFNDLIQINTKIEYGR